MLLILLKQVLLLQLALLEYLTLRLSLAYRSRVVFDAFDECQGLLFLHLVDVFEFLLRVHLLLLREKHLLLDGLGHRVEVLARLLVDRISWDHQQVVRVGGAGRLDGRLRGLLVALHRVRVLSCCILR